MSTPRRKLHARRETAGYSSSASSPVFVWASDRAQADRPAISYDQQLVCPATGGQCDHQPQHNSKGSVSSLQEQHAGATSEFKWISDFIDHDNSHDDHKQQQQQQQQRLAGTGSFWQMCLLLQICMQT
jgi:hypothetical protein